MFYSPEHDPVRVKKLNDLLTRVVGIEESGIPAAEHTHEIAEITGLTTALSGKAPAAHTHTIANVTGLQDALDAKATAATTLGGYGITDGVTTNTTQTVSGQKTHTGLVLWGSSSTNRGRLTTQGKIGLAGKTDTTNGWIYIGTGAGSLTDTGQMGLKIKLDTISGSRNDGQHTNVNIISGTGDGSIRGGVFRLDVNDTASTGDTVALWADTLVSVNAARKAWGANIYVQLGADGAPIDYTAAAVGAEIAVSSWASTVNPGGALHLVSNGGVAASNKMRFGLRFGGNNNAFEHAMICGDGVSAPDKNLIYYGPISLSTEPTGTPLFQVTKTGHLTTTGLKVNGLVNAVDDAAAAAAGVAVGDSYRNGSVLMVRVA